MNRVPPGARAVRLEVDGRVVARLELVEGELVAGVEERLEAAGSTLSQTGGQIRSEVDTSTDSLHPHPPGDCRRETCPLCIKCGEAFGEANERRAIVDYLRSSWSIDVASAIEGGEHHRRRS